MRALLAAAAFLWTVQTSTNLPNWQDVTPTDSSTQAFARLHVLNAPADATVNVDSIIIASAMAFLSNGTLVINGTVSCNDWAALSSMTSTVQADVNIQGPS